MVFAEVRLEWDFFLPYFRLCIESVTRQSQIEAHLHQHSIILLAVFQFVSLSLWVLWIWMLDKVSSTYSCPFASPPYGWKKREKGIMLYLILWSNSNFGLILMALILLDLVWDIHVFDKQEKGSGIIQVLGLVHQGWREFGFWQVWGFCSEVCTWCKLLPYDDLGLVDLISPLCPSFLNHAQIQGFRFFCMGTIGKLIREK